MAVRATSIAATEASTEVPRETIPFSSGRETWTIATSQGRLPLR